MASIDSLEAAERFDRMLNAYAQARTNDAFAQLPVAHALKACQTHPAKTRIVAAVEDLAISFLLLHCDNLGLWTTINATSADDGRCDLTEDERTFIQEMDRHRHASAFVLRYRAAWDKIMGLLVLLYEPTHYDAFCSKRSRIKAFSKLFERRLGTSELGEFLRAFISNFDDAYRTAEAHGVGVLRKTSFAGVSPTEMPQFDFIRYWNAINFTVLMIRGIFDPEDTLKLVSSDMHEQLRGTWAALRTAAFDARGGETI